MGLFPPKGNLSPPPKASACMHHGLQAHQRVPVGPAEVILHSSVTEADPLVVLCVAWKSRRGREEWVTVPLHLVRSVSLPSQLSLALEPLGHSAPSQPLMSFFPLMMLVLLPPHSACHEHGSTHVGMGHCACCIK